MKKRKKKILNREFQLRTTGVVIVTTILSFLLIIGVMVVLIDRSSDAGMLTDTLKELDRSIKTQEDIMQSMIEISRLNRDKGYAIAIADVTKDHGNSMAYIKSNISLLKNSRSTSRTILAFVITIMFLQTVFLFLYLLRATHRVSGPLQVIHGRIWDVLAGEKSGMRGIRKTDRYQDLYHDFNLLLEMIEDGKRESATKSKSVKRKK